MSFQGVQDSKVNSHAISKPSCWFQARLSGLLKSSQYVSRLCHFWLSCDKALGAVVLTKLYRKGTCTTAATEKIIKTTFGHTGSNTAC